jgi:NAD-dependent deacetylase
MGREDSVGKSSLAAAWRQSRSTVVLTGAGISTASGIPDFRSPGGRWSSYQPIPIQDFLASESAREAYWRYKGETWQVIQEAQPNPAHNALTALGNAGRVELLATQNVDGLHERSGFPADRQICVHGTDAEVVCMTCGDRNPRVDAQRSWEAGQGVPVCDCGGPLKPATISFGQNLVDSDLERAFQAASTCELFVAVGTSLVVSPINQMLPIAIRGGAEAAILTASETPFDEVARFRSTRPLEEVLPDVARRVLGN